MSFNKSLIALAIAGGFVSTAAQGVDITDGAVANDTIVASELIIPGAGLLLTNAGSRLDISTQLQYNFSATEVRYARFECSNTLEITSAAVVGTGGALIGAVNGVGTNVISFSITAPAGGLVGADTVTIDGDRTVFAKTGVSCAYSLYDQPSQAANGGAAGLIVRSEGDYLSFAASYMYRTTPNTSIANVEATPSYSAFVNAPPTNTTNVAQLARIIFNRRGFFGLLVQPIKADGTFVQLVDILDASSSHVANGDFTAAANTDGTYTGAALNRVFMSFNSDCSSVDIPASSILPSSATFTTGAVVFNSFLCFAPGTGQLIQASDYTFRFAPVSNPGYVAGTLGPVDSGKIIRNGTELQAPLAQIPGNYISRLVLTNTGSIARSYVATVLREAGNAGTPGAAVTGTVPANGTLVVNMADLLGTFTSGQPRGTVNVTVAGPNNQIQGLYQIVRPDTGAISNHVMVRPGTN